MSFFFLVFRRKLWTTACQLKENVVAMSDLLFSWTGIIWKPPRCGHVLLRRKTLQEMTHLPFGLK